MLKRIIITLLTLSMLLSLTACGQDNSSANPSDNQNEPPVSEVTPDSFDGIKRLEDLISATNPANQYEKLIAARDICQAQYDKAIIALNNAGLSEDQTMSVVIQDWDKWLNSANGRIEEQAGKSEEELNALDDDKDFADIMDFLLPYLTRAHNMMLAVEKDPALWLKQYTSNTTADYESIDFDGTWPEGYFFSDRVPVLEGVNAVTKAASGDIYGFEGGLEYALYVYQIDHDQVLEYIDQLNQAGFYEEAFEDDFGLILWFGRIKDSDGQISVALLYQEDASGTSDSPALSVKFYDYDLVGVMIDMGAIYYHTIY